MEKRSWYFVLVNAVYFIVVFAVYFFGYEYDNENKLVPELVAGPVHTLETRYGERWLRLLKYCVWFGLITDCVIGYVWYRLAPRDGEASIKLD